MARYSIHPAGPGTAAYLRIGQRGGGAAAGSISRHAPRRYPPPQVCDWEVGPDGLWEIDAGRSRSRQPTATALPACLLSALATRTAAPVWFTLCRSVQLPALPWESHSATHRMPSLPPRWYGSTRPRYDARTSLEGLPHDPPRGSLYWPLPGPEGSTGASGE